MSTDLSPGETALVADVAERALALGVGVGVAESLTGGRIAAGLASGDDAATWFRGGVVAYSPEVKFSLLGVERGPVNCASCAREMAQGALRALGSDIAVAITGVGGPGADEGVAAGTVFLACARREHELVERDYRFDGEPDQVIAQATSAVLTLLAECLVEEPA